MECKMEEALLRFVNRIPNVTFDLMMEPGPARLCCLRSNSWSVVLVAVPPRETNQVYFENLRFLEKYS